MVAWATLSEGLALLSCRPFPCSCPPLEPDDLFTDVTEADGAHWTQVSTWRNILGLVGTHLQIATHTS